MTQLEYISILWQECGFDTHVSRSGFMSREFGREVKFVDDLDSREKSLLITALKDIKAGQQERSRSARQREDWEDQE